MALRKIQQKKLILRTKRGLVYLNKEEYECLTKFLPENLIMLTQSHAKQKEEKYQLELNDEELDTLRDLVGEQLQILGFDESYDLTEEGKILESLVDKFFIG
jgi:agmatine/peptidylarginine deiminase